MSSTNKYYVNGRDITEYIDLSGTDSITGYSGINNVTKVASNISSSNYPYIITQSLPNAEYKYQGKDIFLNDNIISKYTDYKFDGYSGQKHYQLTPVDSDFSVFSYIRVVIIGAGGGGGKSGGFFGSVGGGGGGYHCSGYINLSDVSSIDLYVGRGGISDVNEHGYPSNIQINYKDSSICRLIADGGRFGGLPDNGAGGNYSSLNTVKGELFKYAKGITSTSATGGNNGSFNTAEGNIIANDPFKYFSFPTGNTGRGGDVSFVPQNGEHGIIRVYWYNKNLDPSTGT